MRSRDLAIYLLGIAVLCLLALVMFTRHELTTLEDKIVVGVDTSFCIDTDDDTLTDAELKAVIDRALDIDFPLC